MNWRERAAEDEAAPAVGGTLHQPLAASLGKGRGLIALLTGAVMFALGLFFGWLLHRERVERALYEDAVRARDRAHTTLAETSARLELANNDMVRLRKQLTDARQQLAEREDTSAEPQVVAAHATDDDTADGDDNTDLAARDRASATARSHRTGRVGAEAAADAQLFDQLALDDDVDIDDEADITDEVPLPIDDAGHAEAAADHDEAERAVGDDRNLDDAPDPSDDGSPVEPHAIAQPRGDAAVEAVPDHGPEDPPEVTTDADVDGLGEVPPLEDAVASSAPDGDPEPVADERPHRADPAPAIVQDAVDVGNDRPTSGIGEPLVVEPDAGRGAPPDDLRQISGVGPALERLLHEEGITTFRQLASLDEPAIEALRTRSPRLVTRLRHDAWVSQARQLHVDTHGDEP